MGPGRTHFDTEDAAATARSQRVIERYHPRLIIMKLTFRGLAILSAIMFITLAVVWVVEPNFFLSRWGLAFSYPVGLVGRRGAALCLGIGVMFFSARNALPSPARSALVTGCMVACSTLAIMGMYELISGHVGTGILSASLIEIALTLAFAYVTLRERRA